MLDDPGELAGTPGEEPGALVAPNWGDPEHVSHGEWRTFVRWVRHLTDRYRDLGRVGLQSCWHEHPLMVDDLTALWVAQRTAQDHLSGNPNAALDWMEQFARATDRWRRWKEIGQPGCDAHNSVPWRDLDVESYWFGIEGGTPPHPEDPDPVARAASPSAEHTISEVRFIRHQHSDATQR